MSPSRKPFSFIIYFSLLRCIACVPIDYKVMIKVSGSTLCTISNGCGSNSPIYYRLCNLDGTQCGIWVNTNGVLLAPATWYPFTYTIQNDIGSIHRLQIANTGNDKLWISSTKVNNIEYDYGSGQVGLETGLTVDCSVLTVILSPNIWNKDNYGSCPYNFDDTYSPSKTPTITPSYTPSKTPSKAPSQTPSHMPSYTPSKMPTTIPTTIPTSTPTITPTITPSITPSISPTTHIPTTSIPSLTSDQFSTSTPTNIDSKSVTDSLYILSTTNILASDLKNTGANSNAIIIVIIVILCICLMIFFCILFVNKTRNAKQKETIHDEQKQKQELVSVKSISSHNIVDTQKYDMEGNIESNNQNISDDELIIDEINANYNVETVGNINSNDSELASDDIIVGDITTNGLDHAQENDFVIDDDSINSDDNNTKY